MKKELDNSFPLYISSTARLFKNYFYERSNDSYGNLLDKLKNCEIPDVIILNDTSYKDFDFAALKLTKEIHAAPCVIFANNKDESLCSFKEYKSKLELLKNYAKTNNILLYYGIEIKDSKLSSSGLLKKIKECGEGNLISEDLYQEVVFIYVELSHR